ncbi:MAG: SCP2 sterol-binding domain-containing protein [Asticcacaulis sp.]
MGRHGRDGYVLRPKGWPVLFRLQLDPGAAEVGVFPASATPACQAEIEARLTVLIAIAEGKLDADSAFFSRNVTIRGNTGSVMALHNTLEASELDIAAFLGLPATAQSGFRTLLGLLKSDIYEPVAHV